MLDLKTSLRNADEHKKNRIGSLVNQITQVKDEIHSAVEKIHEDIEKVHDLEAEIKVKRSLTHKNLTAAILLARDAKSKLEALDASELRKIALEENPSKGLEALIKCYLYLLASIVPSNLIGVNARNEPKETNWKACQRLLRESESFIEGLQNLRGRIDEMSVVKSNIDCVKLILGESFFDFEKFTGSSQTLESLYSYAQSILGYYDLIYVSKVSERDTTRATAQLEVSSTQILHDEEEIQKLKQVSDQLYNELNKAASEP